MALQSVLARFCPQPDGIIDPSSHPLACALHCNLLLAPRDGDAIPCHEELLRARCPKLPDALAGGVVEVDVERSVVFALLRWIYSEVLDLRPFPHQNLGPDVVRLAFAWGLRDASMLRMRIVASWKRERCEGTLVEDLQRAYNSGAWGKDFTFHTMGDKPGECISTPLSGGWSALLQARSSYFEAMLGGKWSESSGELGIVTIHWPRLLLEKLIRFLHGAPFVGAVGDLQAAVECASFFGVPALVAEANDWIATNLKLANAPTLWDFVDKEPRLRLGDSKEELEVADASDACLDFHIRHFAQLAEDPDEGDGSWAPLHDLSHSLMRKLLATGLVDMPRDALLVVVERFVCAKCGRKGGKEYAELLQSLRPPAVLFNRELRNMLTGTVDASIWNIL